MELSRSVLRVVDALQARRNGNTSNFRGKVRSDGSLKRGKYPARLPVAVAN